ncbi:MAG: hypothetical protein IKL08_05000, partial [Clostridia bacterium]|nr:hypothetical protein [Clostridia bacterium]
IDVEIDGAKIDGKMAIYGDGKASNTLTFKSGTVSDLKTAIDNVVGSGTITLLKDIEIKDFIIIDNGNEYTLDLNGHTITVTADPMLKLKNGILNLIDTAEKKGKISGTKGLIWVFGDSANNRELTIDKGVVLETQNSMCVYVCNENSILRTSGDLTSVNDAAIKGHGSAGYGGIEVYVTDGNVISDNGLAIYFPNTSLLEITGGYLKGPTAIYQKAGTLNISGSAIIEADGEKSDYEYNGSGAHITGDAVVVDFCNYPGGEPAISITGGYFKSANNRDVASYATTEGSEIVGFISGGYFTTNPTEYLASGKAAVTSDDSDYKYMVGEKLVDVTTATEVAKPSVEVSEDVVIDEEKFEADTAVMESIASSYANSEDVVGNSGDAISALVEGEVIASGDIAEVTVVVMPYIDVKVESGDNSLIIDITPLYNVVATIASGETKIETSGDNQNAVILKEAMPFEITEPIDITIPLPAGYASGDSTLYVHHTKVDGTKELVYVY